MSVRIFAMAALLGSLALQPAVAQGHPNFAGTWKLNTAASDPMGAPGGTISPAPITITQTDTRLVIERKFNDQTVTTTYNLDGTESTNAGRGGDAKSTAQWEGAALVVETTSASGMKSSEVRTLSADGKTMTVVRTSQGTNGPSTRKSVYDKQ